MQPPIAIDDATRSILAGGGYVALNLSGGKDSGAAGAVTVRFLDGMGHPRDRRLAIHADLGRAEWRETEAMVERQAHFMGVPLVVVRRKAGDMVQRWEQRFKNGLSRYIALETYNLIGPWSSSALRFCQSELKAQVIGPHLARELKGQQIVQVVGIRRDESVKRRSTPISKADLRYAKTGNRAGTTMCLWHPVVTWSTEQVLDYHAVVGLDLHPAYHAGCSRVSCAFCVMQSLKDAKVAASIAGNIPLYLHLVEMEANSSFSFWPKGWLADVAPQLLSPALAAAITVAKHKAVERQSIEAAMPAGLRYVKGWPIRVPANDEAERIVVARRAILGHHGAEDPYGTPRAVIDRFAELMALAA
jgi:3'-phosphoadenosine 5'-phosphosulfate sulfotransferase (PAPS reductase)/FAD synthetase